MQDPRAMILLPRPRKSIVEEGRHVALCNVFASCEYCCSHHDHAGVANTGGVLWHVHAMVLNTTEGIGSSSHQA